MDEKVIWRSKIFWANIISLLALLVQYKYGFVVPVEAQEGAVSVLNIILRFYTTKAVTWTTK